eukprot:scaffold175313_cov52-Attheya_sp.AAC.2
MLRVLRLSLEATLVSTTYGTLAGIRGSWNSEQVRASARGRFRGAPIKTAFVLQFRESSGSGSNEERSRCRSMSASLL